MSWHLDLVKLPEQVTSNLEIFGISVDKGQVSFKNIIPDDIYTSSVTIWFKCAFQTLNNGWNALELWGILG